MRWRNGEYQKWVAGLECARCARPGPNQCHHIKGVGHLGGAGLKAPDMYCVPLCPSCHHDLHQHAHIDMLKEQWEWAARTQARFIETLAACLDGAGMNNLIRMVDTH